MWRYDDLAIFINVVERGSFIAAATKMKIPSSTVSRRLSRLEADLNVKLLERTSRKIHLTEKGKIFFEQCLPLIKQLRENTHELTQSMDKIHGKLKVTVPTYVGNELMADLFTDFVKNNPDIELEILLSNDIEDILDEEIDIAIRVGPLDDSTLIAQNLLELDYVICASTEYLEQHGVPQEPADINRDHSFIFRTYQESLNLKHRTSGVKVNIDARKRLLSNDIKFTIHAVNHGAGIACLPKMFIKQQLESGNLVEILPHYQLLEHKTIYAVYPGKRYLPKKTRLLIKYIKTRFLQLATAL